MEGEPDSPETFACTINLLVWAGRRAAEFPGMDRQALLARADALAREGVARFMDATSPLPKFTQSETLYAHNGDVWVPYYHAHAGCDDFMFALVNLAAAINRP